MTVLLLPTVLLLAYANGANDNLKPTATLFGAGTLGFGGSRRLATAAQIAGSAVSLVLATRLTEAFRGQGLVADSVVADPSFLFAVGLGAAATVLLATRLGLPISTTHALVGGLSGAAIAHLPWAEIHFGVLGTRYFLPLASSPLVTAALAGVGAVALRRVRTSRRDDDCLCIGEPTRALTGGTAALTASPMVFTCASDTRDAGGVLTLDHLTDGLHLASASALGFARGLNDTPKIFALLSVAPLAGLGPRAALASVAAAMALGGWWHSREVARTLALELTEIERGNGTVANLVSSAVVIGASAMGLPVSTTHVSTGSLLGIGWESGRLRPARIRQVLAAWLFTLPMAAALAFAVTWAAR